MLEKKIWANNKLKEMGIYTGDASAMRSIWIAMLQSNKTLMGLTAQSAIQVMLAANHPALFLVK